MCPSSLEKNAIKMSLAENAFGTFQKTNEGDFSRGVIAI